MRTRDEIAKDSGCTELEYGDNASTRIGLLTLEVLVDIRDQNDIMIGLLQYIARENRSRYKPDIDDDKSFVRGGNNITLASDQSYYSTGSSIAITR